MRCSKLPGGGGRQSSLEHQLVAASAGLDIHCNTTLQAYSLQDVHLVY